MQLTIANATKSVYYCHASNALGSFTHTVKVSFSIDIFLYPFHTEVQNTKEENRIDFFPIDQ